MTLRKDAEGFSDDAPKTNPWQDDALGYRGFSDRLAAALVGIQAPNGYVVGLHGPWGSGKSTVLNFVESFMRKRQEEGEGSYVATTLIRFEPWIVSGYQDLAAAFFKQLSTRIADGIANRDGRKFRALKTLKLGIDPVIDAAAKLGATMDHTGGSLSRGVAGVAKKGVGGAIDRWLAEPSLQDTYEQLSERLLAAGGRYVVMIDDIDRLTTDEIRSIMQMVKTVGRLPNVVYLLAYDREIVWAALREKENDTPATRRPEFAEKIIQHEVELPMPSRHSLLAMLDAEIAFLPSPPPDSTRWLEMVQASIYRWIRHPRDVARLANAIRFSWPALAGEMDPQDLLSMEGLRLFERPVFDWVRANRDLLLNEGRARYLVRDKQSTFTDEFRASLPAASRKDILTLLGALFPNSDKLFRDGPNFINEPWYSVAARRGVATKPAFDAYFSLSPSPTEIPKALIDQAMSSLEDEEFQIACIDDAAVKTDEFGNTLVGNYFQELQYRFNGQPVLPAQALINALVRKADEMEAIDWRGDIFTPVNTLHFLLIQLLKGLGRSGAAEALETAFERTESIVTKADLLVHEARELGLMPVIGSSREPSISADDLRRLAQPMLPAIERAAADGSLDDALHYYSVLRLWAFLGGTEAARSWISRVALSSPKRFANVCNALVGYSRSERGNFYSFNEKPDPEFYDLAVIREAAARFAEASDVSEDERRKIVAVRDGLTKFEEAEVEEVDLQ